MRVVVDVVVDVIVVELVAFVAAHERRTPMVNMVVEPLSAHG